MRRKFSSFLRRNIEFATTILLSGLLFDLKYFHLFAELKQDLLCHLSALKKFNVFAALVETYLRHILAPLQCTFFTAKYGTYNANSVIVNGYFVRDHFGFCDACEVAFATPITATKTYASCDQYVQRCKMSLKTYLLCPLCSHKNLCFFAPSLKILFKVAQPPLWPLQVALSTHGHYMVRFEEALTYLANFLNWDHHYTFF